MGRKRIYTDEERKQRQREAVKKWEKTTPKGRACHLLQTYKQFDRKYNRGEGNLTSEWIVENIFSKPCAHCGKTGWQVIGCNRLDNSKPHTIDNVEPCCKECNSNLNHRDLSLIVYQYTLGGELVGIYSSTREVERRLGYCHKEISACCNGKRKNNYKGFQWSYTKIN